MLSKLLCMTLLITPYTLYALNECQKNALKIRGSALIPQSKRFRTIYGSAAGAIELEYVRYICEHIAFWTNLDGVIKRGCSIGFRNRTQVDIANFSFGLDFPWQVGDRSTLYMGFGPSFGTVHLTNNSICGCEKVSKGAIGFVAKSGFNICLSKHTFIELFADYLFERACFQNKVHIGGLKPGIALGITF